MTWFWLARVELHGSKSETDYDRLHDAMAERSFYRLVSDVSGTWKLPRGTYSRVESGLTSRVEMQAIVAEATGTIQLPFWTIVTRCRTEDTVMFSESISVNPGYSWSGKTPDLLFLR